MEKSIIIEEYLRLKESLNQLKNGVQYLSIDEEKKKNLEEQESYRSKIKAKEKQLYEIDKNYCERVKEQMMVQIGEYNKIIKDRIKSNSRCRIAIELGSKMNLIMVIINDIELVLLSPGWKRVPIELQCTNEFKNSIDAENLRFFLMDEQKIINDINDVNIVMLADYKERFEERIRREYNIKY